MRAKFQEKDILFNLAWVTGVENEFLNIKQFTSELQDDLITSPDKTPATKTDAATSTTPHSSVETEPSITGIHQVVKEPETSKPRQLLGQSTPTSVHQQSPSQLVTSYSSKTTVSASQTSMHQPTSLHQPAKLPSSLHLAQSGSSLVQQSVGLTQSAPPPNLSPPNIDNIRNGEFEYGQVLNYGSFQFNLDLKMECTFYVTDVVP